MADPSGTATHNIIFGYSISQQNVPDVDHGIIHHVHTEDSDAIHYMIDWTTEQHSWIESHLDIYKSPPENDLQNLANKFRSQFGRSLHVEDLWKKWFSHILVFTAIGETATRSRGNLTYLDTSKKRTSPRLQEKGKGKTILNKTNPPKLVKDRGSKNPKVSKRKKQQSGIPNPVGTAHGNWTDLIIPGDEELAELYHKDGYPPPGDPIYKTEPVKRLHPLHPKYAYMTKALRDGGYHWKEIFWLFGKQEEIPYWPERFPNMVAKQMLTIGSRSLGMRWKRV